ncbi:MAG: glycosyltransferase family 2 protein [Elusimicrobia bacterium]|nr:glycosyltransferase family 2 protein [Elusimicrobiota bacterium]
MKVSVIIPTLEEAGCIGKLLSEIPKDIIDEIIVVDGHSKDGTADIVRNMGHKVIMQEGHGYGGAFIQGVNASAGDVVVLMDADGSQNPKDISKLLKKLNEGYDCVFASRYTIESHSEDDTLVRSFGNWLITLLVNVLFHVRTSDSLFLFTAIRKDIFYKLGAGSHGFEFCVEVLLKACVGKYKLGEIPSTERKRYSGRSKVRALLHGFKIIKSIIYWRLKLRKKIKSPKIP